jgi:hypothetical protein
MDQVKIDELKAKYGKIYKITINDVEWFYRAMTRNEYKNHSEEQTKQNQLSQLDLEDMVFLVCNLNDIKTKEQLPNIPAGVISTVADLIMKATGFSDVNEPEEL